MVKEDLSQLLCDSEGYTQLTQHRARASIKRYRNSVFTFREIDRCLLVSGEVLLVLVLCYYAIKCATQGIEGEDEAVSSVAGIMTYQVSEDDWVNVLLSVCSSLWKYEQRYMCDIAGEDKVTCVVIDRENSDAGETVLSFYQGSCA